MRRDVAVCPPSYFEPAESDRVPAPSAADLARVRAFIDTLDPSLTTWMREEDAGACQQVSERHHRRKRKARCPRRADDCNDVHDTEDQEQDLAASCLLLLLASGTAQPARPARSSKATKAPKGWGGKRSARGGMSAEEVLRVSQERQLRKKSVSQRSGACSARRFRHLGQW